MVTDEAIFMPPAERLFRRNRHGRGFSSGWPVGQAILDAPSNRRA